jgi:6-phosphogluconate dehydrogenase
MDKLPKKQIGLIGLGRMGAALAQNLLRNGWEVAGLDNDPQKVKALEPKGLKEFYATPDLVKYLSKPRIIWLMVNAGEPVQQVLFGQNGLINHLEAGDIVIDGGNSYFEDSIVTSQILNEKNISFLDVGIGNGPEGAQFGASLMIGGPRPVYSHAEELFKTLSVQNGYKHVGKTGSGHFIKMIHNAILYGYSQAIAEGFDVIKMNGHFEFNLSEIAKLYNTGSLIESTIMGCTEKAFEKFGDGLGEIKSIPFSQQESEHIKDFAKSRKIKLPTIEEAIKIREENANTPSYQARIVMAIRNIFGGHPINQ